MSFTDGAEEDGALERPNNTKDTGCLVFVSVSILVLLLSGYSLVRGVV